MSDATSEPWLPEPDDPADFDVIDLYECLTPGCYTAFDADRDPVCPVCGQVAVIEP